MVPYTTITIIYNPNSTRPSKRLARELQYKLTAAMPKQEITMIPTDYAHHAEELAYTLAKASKKPLIISSSGDGGYHEVINGLMRAQAEGAKPTASLLPAGNANDHYKAVHEKDIVHAITHGESKKIDLLKVSGVVDGQPFERYAHSYAGIGLTPKVGEELNRHKLNWYLEMWIVFKILLMLRPVHIMVNDERKTYDSLVFNNIHRMAKYLSLAHKTAHDDGEFEITGFYSHNKIRVIIGLLTAPLTGLVIHEKRKNFTFRTIKPTLLQLDGEVGTVDAETDVKISLAPGKLNCIV